MCTYLSINFVNSGGSGVKCQEQVISAPLDEISHMVIFADGLVFVIVFDETPTQHCDGICHGKMEFDVVSSIIISSKKASLEFCIVSILQP